MEDYEKHGNFPKLKEHLGKMPEADFWKWVGTWLDPVSVMDMVECWSETTCEEELKKLGRKNKHGNEKR